jgi:hypothetical protein
MNSLEIRNKRKRSRNIRNWNLNDKFCYTQISSTITLKFFKIEQRSFKYDQLYTWVWKLPLEILQLSSQVYINRDQSVCYGSLLLTVDLPPNRVCFNWLLSINYILLLFWSLSLSGLDWVLKHMNWDRSVNKSGGRGKGQSKLVNFQPPLSIAIPRLI